MIILKNHQETLFRVEVKFACESKFKADMSGPSPGILTAIVSSYLFFSNFSIYIYLGMVGG